MKAASSAPERAVIIRKLRTGDLPDLMALTMAAGWNQTEDDWLLFLRYEPHGCFGIEVDGVVVATATAMCYEMDLAWIAMVLTLPNHRGRGYARALTQRAIEYAGQRAIRLDASDLGRPLYEAMGFVAECAVERWQRLPGEYIEAAVVEPLNYSSAFDTVVFGANRSRLLMELANRGESASVNGGYAFSRRATNGFSFGPCVAESPEKAALLLSWFVANHWSEVLVMDLFPEHAHAPRIASEFSFAPVRRLTRMVKNPAPVSLPDARIYATANFSWG